MHANRPGEFHSKYNRRTDLVLDYGGNLLISSTFNISKEPFTWIDLQTSFSLLLYFLNKMAKRTLGKYMLSKIVFNWNRHPNQTFHFPIIFGLEVKMFRKSSMLLENRDIPWDTPWDIPFEIIPSPLGCLLLFGQWFPLEF